MTIPAFRAHDAALVDLIETIGPPVGDADGSGLEPPFYVVYRGPSALEGTLDAPEDDGRVLYQVSCVGESPEAAEGLADAARATVLTAALLVSGRAIPRIEHAGGRGAARDEAGGERWFTAIEEFRVWTTPGGGS